MSRFGQPAVAKEFEDFKFSRVIPSWEVESIDRSIEFYTTQLPFFLSGRDTINHCWLTLQGSESIHHPTGVQQGSVNIYLRRKGFLAPGERPNPQPGKGLIYIRVDGPEEQIEKFHSILITKGLSISQELMTTPWGSIKFAIYDLDHNEICFYMMKKPGSKA